MGAGGEARDSIGIRAHAYAGLSQHERRLLFEVESALATFRPGQQPPHVAPIIQELLGVDIVALCAPDVPDGEQHSIVLRQIDMAGDSLTRYVPELADGMSTGRLSFVFTMRAPEPAQRNRPVAILGTQAVEYGRLGLSRASWDGLRDRVERLVRLLDRHGIANHHQMRTLICDETLLLRYFNVMHERPLTARQSRLYRALLKPLHDRAVMEHRLASAGMYRAALDATLEGVDRAAFITDRNARVIHANQIGSIELARDTELPGRLAEAIKGRRDEFTVRPIASNGAPLEYLIMARRAMLEETARAVAAEIGLGDRATEVLVLVAAAEPTKLIASRLGVAQGTIEYHITALFRRLGVSSRSELQRLLADRA